MTEEIKSILGGAAVLFALGMFFAEFLGIISGLALIASSVALLLAYWGVIPWDAMCWMGLAVVVGAALDWSRYSTRVDRAIRRRNEYDRLQAIETAWWDAHPDAHDQLNAWLRREHGLDDLDIRNPMLISDGKGNMLNAWSSRRGQRVTVPVVYEHLIGPWTTQPRAEWIRELRKWEAYKQQHAGDLDALQAYVEGRR